MRSNGGPSLANGVPIADKGSRGEIAGRTSPGFSVAASSKCKFPLAAFHRASDSSITQATAAWRARISWLVKLFCRASDAPGTDSPHQTQACRGRQWAQENRPCRRGFVFFFHQQIKETKTLAVGAVFCRGARYGIFSGKRSRIPPGICAPLDGPACENSVDPRSASCFKRVSK